MTRIIQSIRGMNDILPQETANWRYLEQQLCELAGYYGYQEIRMPLLEHTSLFSRTIGEATDIVEKEMYTFADRNGDSLSLRPEGTASCVRAGIQHGLLYNQTQRLWYMGPMFRHERPQQGRFRQFFQFALEAFGFSGPDIDAELLLFCHTVWQRLGIQDKVTLQLNTLGELAARQRYKEALVAYLERYSSELDADSQRRLVTNPLRILDSKHERTQEILQDAPQLITYLDAESKAHFIQLQEYLNACNIHYTVNPRLVRGLDYYNRTVFEWVTSELGAQGTVCAGGHYDGLVEQLGGKATPAAGFALGLERLLALLEQAQNLPGVQLPYIYIAVLMEAAIPVALQLRQSLLQTIRFPIIVHCGGGTVKSQLKKADKSGAKIAMLLGEEEIAYNVVTIKWLRIDRPQIRVDIAKVNEYLTTAQEP